MMNSGSSAETAFARELNRVQQRLVEMASRVEFMVAQAIESLSKLDTEQAMHVLRLDDKIDELDLSVESQCLALLRLEEPAPLDLRMIGTAIKMTTDIERVGDLAVDIAKCGMKIEKEGGRTDYVDLLRIGNPARQMFREAIEAFVKRDLGLLEGIVLLEDRVDETYRDIRGQIHAYMRSEPSEVVSAGWMLLAIHHIERVADHALNIAERVGFVVTGELKQLRGPAYFRAKALDNPQ